MKYGTDCSKYLNEQIILKNMESFYEFIGNDGEKFDIEFEVNDTNIGEWHIKINRLPEGKLKKSFDKILKKELEVIVEFPEDFPFSPPFVWIKSPNIIHIDEGSTFAIFNGAICTSVLFNEDWKPTYTISQLLLILISLLVDGSQVKDDNINSRSSAFSGKQRISSAHKNWTE